MSIVTRNGKGSALTYEELDGNIEQFYISSSINGNSISLFTSGGQASGVGDVVTLPTAGTLQAVTDLGNTTTNQITADSFVKDTATSDDILLGDGSTTSLSALGVSINTGSFYLSSSVNLNTITFTQGDGTFESLTVNTGSASTAVYELNPSVGGQNRIETVFESTNNTFGDNSTIAGGTSNGVKSGAEKTFIGSGNGNEISGSFSFVGAGLTNIITSTYAVAAGGRGSTITGTASSIVGGYNNTTDGDYSFIGGGYQNSIESSAEGYSNITSGRDNTVSGDYINIAGGRDNIANSGIYSSIGGGRYNTGSASYVHIGGGLSNSIKNGASKSTIGGGSLNSINFGQNSTIAGGLDNESTSAYTSIGGGQDNSTTGQHSTIAGGSNNSTTAIKSAILGGLDNTVTAAYGAILAGQDNTVGHSHSSVVAGQNITTTRSDTAYASSFYASGSLGDTGTQGVMQLSSRTFFPTGTDEELDGMLVLKGGNIKHLYIRRTVSGTPEWTQLT
jgi:hypothetical protein